jgi:alpha/beta superfamily hydrolase
MSAGTSRLVPVTLAGPAGALEALLQVREPPEHDTVAVVCHPHPLYGGTMHNKVVHRVASVMHQLGAAVLRFNFRGVGKSQGRHDRGEGELEDARVALEWVSARHPGAKRWLAGFSFGSWVAARLAAATPDIDQLLLVAPPLHTSSFETMKHATVRKRVVQGTADDVCKLERLEHEFPTWAEPKRLILVEGAGHFFDRKLEPLAQAVSDLLTGP